MLASQDEADDYLTEVWVEDTINGKAEPVIPGLDKFHYDDQPSHRSIIEDIIVYLDIPPCISGKLIFHCLLLC